MKNTADLTGGKPSDRRSSHVNAVNPLVPYYDFHGRKGEVLFFCSVPNTTRDSVSDTTRDFPVVRDIKYEK
jgi:hypothetical protein